MAGKIKEVLTIKNKTKKDNFKLADPAVGILRRVSGSRNARAFFMRKTTANLMERLTNEEQDAMIQIAVARQLVMGAIQDGRGHFRQFKYGELSGRSLSEYSDFCIDLSNRYLKWMEAMDSNAQARDVCIHICWDETAVTKLSRKYKKQWDTMFAIFRFALAEWLKIRQISLTANDNNGTMVTNH